MRASSSPLFHGNEDWVAEVHSGSRVVRVIGRTPAVGLGLGVGRLVDHMSTGMVSLESPQESPDHRLVAVLSWMVVVVIVKGTLVHESINEKYLSDAIADCRISSLTLYIQMQMIDNMAHVGMNHQPTPSGSVPVRDTVLRIVKDS